MLVVETRLYPDSPQSQSLCSQQLDYTASKGFLENVSSIMLSSYMSRIEHENLPIYETIICTSIYQKI